MTFEFKKMKKVLSSSVHLRWPVSLIAEILTGVRTRSFVSLEWLTPHLVHSEWSVAASIVARSVGLVEVGTSRHWRLIALVPHVVGVRWRTIPELPLPERHGRGLITAAKARNRASTLVWWIIIVEAIRIRSVHHFAIATCSWFFEVRVEVLLMMRNFAVTSSTIISVSMIVASR